MSRFTCKPHVVKSAETQAVSLSPSELVRLYFKLPHRTGYKPFSFQGRRYFVDIYDTESRRILMMCGRQVAKSTTIGNKLLTYSVALPHFKSLYVAPTQLQSGQFSNDRIRLPIYYSEFLQTFVNSSVVDRVNHRSFLTGAEIRLRHAFLNADRIRGIQTDLLCVDELQDIDVDLLPIMEETLFTSEYRMLLYSGTPKSEDNTIAKYWYENSTQSEWAIPCDRHAPYYWNIAGEENIPSKAEDGLVCAKCKKSIDPMHEKAHWAAMNPTPNAQIPYLGVRIPQLITPTVDWREILDKYRRYPRQLFFNEILGLPYESGMRPLTREEIERVCDPGASITRSASYERNLTWALERNKHNIYMGVDWGTSESGNSFTYVVIGGYFGGDHFRVVYFHRFEGTEAEPERQLAILEQLVHQFNVSLIGTDYGGGFVQNDKLVRWFGPQRVFKYQYGDLSEKLRWDGKLGRFLVRKHEVMSDIFEAIKRRVFLFPRWEEMDGYLAQEMLNIHSEYNESRGITEFSHSPKSPDDGYHALVYCFLVSSIKQPRPDVFVANKDPSR